jgi:hypothetical protein
MTLVCKKSKTIKTYYCQQHGLNLKKVMAPLTKNEKKKTPLLPMTIINRFEKSCGTFKRGGRTNPLWSTPIRLICLQKNKTLFY